MHRHAKSLDVIFPGLHLCWGKKLSNLHVSRSLSVVLSHQLLKRIFRKTGKLLRVHQRPIEQELLTPGAVVLSIDPDHVIVTKRRKYCRPPEKISLSMGRHHHRPVCFRGYTSISPSIYIRPPSESLFKRETIFKFFREILSARNRTPPTQRNY